MTKDKTCFCRKTSIDLTNDLSSDGLRLRTETFIYSIQNRADDSLEFLEKEYEEIARLRLAIEFIDLCLVDAFRTGEMDELIQISFFPSTEAQMEFDQALKHALIGSYKSAYGFLRRGFELSLLHMYFSITKDYKKSRAWLNSKEDTQFFSKILKGLFNNFRFKAFNKAFIWETDLKNLYYELCDFTHVKGMSKGFRKLNKVNCFVSGSFFESTSTESLRHFSDILIVTVEVISVALALYNPILLEGLDLDGKYGLNGPISGYFYPGQSARINALIPDRYTAHFSKLREEDEDVKGFLEWFNGIPDITEEEFQEQTKEFNQNMERSSRKKS